MAALSAPEQHAAAWLAHLTGASVSVSCCGAAVSWSFSRRHPRGRVFCGVVLRLRGQGGGTVWPHPSLGVQYRLPGLITSIAWGRAAEAYIPSTPPGT